MDTQEIKKDIKNIHISKDTTIVVLAIALVLVSTMAVCMSFGRGHMDRYDRQGRMDQGFQRQFMGRNNFNTNPTINPITAPVIPPAPVAPQ
jgi:hypothetical protein